MAITLLFEPKTGADARYDSVIAALKVPRSFVGYIKKAPSRQFLIQRNVAP